MESSRLFFGGFYQSIKNGLRGTEKEETETADEMGEVEAVMSSSMFLGMEKKQAGVYLFEKGDAHLRNHYAEGGDPVELNLAMSFFYASEKLGNPDAERQLRIQQNIEVATNFYNKGLKYWDGLDGYEKDKDHAEKYMKQACDLGLFAAAEWCEKNLKQSYPLVVRLGDW